MYRFRGPICELTRDLIDIDDGTLARYSSPLPGVIGCAPTVFLEDWDAPTILVAEDILAIAPKAGSNAADIATALNKATTDASITTRIGQAMLIAECAEESGGFAGDEYVESGVHSLVVFNARPNIDAKFKVKAVQTNQLERYLQGPKVATWKTSRDKYNQAQRDYEKANPGKTFEALIGDKAWQPVALTDYLRGDEELPYWKLWYDPSSPHLGRSQMAKDNGNKDVGDGLKYIGRGFIQLTWRCNYRAAGTALNLPLEQQPEAAAKMATAIRIVAWYWKSRSLNNYTKVDSPANFKEVTKRINPGLAGMAERLRYYAQAKKTLGIEAVQAAAK